MANKRNLTCIICPKGCPLVVDFNEDGSIKEITGNACKRGVTYATTECTHPTRTVTSTMRCEDGSVVPVKTSAAVPKELMFEVMARINSTLVKGEVKIGDVVIPSVCGTDADVVITGNKSK